MGPELYHSLISHSRSLNSQFFDTQLTARKCSIQLLMTGFEPRSSSARSDCCANCAVTLCDHLSISCTGVGFKPSDICISRPSTSPRRTTAQVLLLFVAMLRHGTKFKSEPFVSHAKGWVLVTNNNNKGYGLRR